MTGDQRPAEGTPEYDWLYGTNTAPRQRGRPAADPDATQVMSSGTSGRSGGSGGTRPRGQQPPVTPSTPEPTRILPSQPAPAPGRPGPPRGPGAPGPSTTGGRPRARRFRRFGLIRLLLLVWLVFLIAVPWWAWSRITKVDAEPSGKRPGDQRGTTYLLVGSDSRAGLDKKQRRELGTGDAAGQRTDTIMLLHTGSGPNLLMSIPRDSLVDIPGRGTTKINAAFAYGGPELLVKTIERNTGIRIDNYVEIGFGGLVNVVDAVGGVEICPRRRLEDPLANLDVKKGCQNADGKTALGYARTRKTQRLGDISRARNQREVVSAIGSKAASPWTVLNPVRYVRVANAGAGAFAISDETGPFDLARFAWAMTRVSGEKGLTCGVPIADLSVQWDESRSRQMFDYIISDKVGDIPKKLCTPSGLP
ncbi:MAG: LCP family protein [Nocardioides sp.]